MRTQVPGGGDRIDVAGRVLSRATRATRLRVLEALTVVVPAVFAGIYETARHSFLANELPDVLGTALAVTIVLALSFAFARVSFGIIRQMDARLVERNRRLHALSMDARRLATLEERERLAREMHDGVAQVIATLLVRADTIESLVTRGRIVEAASELRDLRASSDLANVEVREAIAGLRANPEPGAAGLSTALREYVEDFGSRTGLDVRYAGPSTFPGRAPGLAPGHELHLMRVVIEGLTNVRKHARARQVTVSLERQGDRWSLRVEDDGTGFDPAGIADERGASPSAESLPTLAASVGRAGFPEREGVAATETGLETVARRRRFGLAMIRERVESLGGRCAIHSSLGAGTRIEVSVPAAATSGEEEDIDPVAIARPYERPSEAPPRAGGSAP